MSKIKVGIFSNYINPNVGGHAASMYGLAKALEKNGCHVTVFCLNDKLNKEIEINKILTKKKNNFFLPGVLTNSFAAARKAKQMEDQFDLFHSNIGFGFPYVFSKYRKPFILHCRADYLKHIKKHFIPPFQSVGSNFYDLVLTMMMWMMKKIVILKSDMIFCNSIIVANEAKRLLPFNKKKVIIIPNGVNTDIFSQVQKKTYKKKYNLYDKKVIGCISRIVPAKQKIFLSIIAMEEVVSYRDDIVLLIAGGGEFRKKLKQIIKKKNLTKNVKLIGHIPHQEVGTFFNTIDMHVPSSAGRTIIEGLLLKKPFILLNTDNDIALPSKLLKSYGTTVTSEKELAQMILKKIDDLEWQKEKGEKGYQFVVKYLTWDRISKKTIQHYSKLCKTQK